VGDLAELAVESGQRSDSYIVDAVGPEIYTYKELVGMIRRDIGSKSLLVHLPPGLIRLASGILGTILKDVVLTDEEIKGLMADLLVSHGPPTGQTSLEAWVKGHAETIGNRYASELGRHYRSGNSERSSCSVS
jgi:hypothetical protein